MAKLLNLLYDRMMVVFRHVNKVHVKLVVLLLLVCLMIYLLFLDNQKRQYRRDILPDEDPLLAVIPGLQQEDLNVSSDQMCTFGLFRRFYTQYHSFPAAGEWMDEVDEVSQYQPEICKYGHIDSSHDLASCFKDANIKSMTILGDYNAMLYYKSFTDLLSKASNESCLTVDEEDITSRGFRPDSHYFTRGRNQSWTRYIITKYRHCISCRGIQQLCHLDTGDGTPHPLFHELIAITQIMDDAIQLHVPIEELGDGILMDVWALTTQEVIFKYFLKNRFPDLLLILLPLNHAKMFTIRETKVNMQFFKGLLDLYVPETTKVFILPTFAESEASRLSKFWVNHLFEDRLATEQIRILNSLWHTLNEERLVDPEGQMYGFLDLLEMSLGREDWNVDGMHMNQAWYKLISTLFLETLCNSLKEEDF